MDLSEAEMKRLSAMELGYDVRDVIVTAADGTGYRSKAFITEWSVRLFEESAPTHDYIGKLRAGAEQFNLPSKYQVSNTVASFLPKMLQRHLVFDGLIQSTRV